MGQLIPDKEGTLELTSLYNNKKYNFLEKYKEVLGEHLQMCDIIGEGGNTIIIRHPTNNKLIVKIAKPGDVDSLISEFDNHKEVLHNDINYLIVVTGESISENFQKSKKKNK